MVDVTDIHEVSQGYHESFLMDRLHPVQGEKHGRRHYDDQQPKGLFVGEEPWPSDNEGGSNQDKDKGEHIGQKSGDCRHGISDGLP